jgi:hypothetical protein
MSAIVDTGNALIVGKFMLLREQNLWQSNGIARHDVFSLGRVTHSQ